MSLYLKYRPKTLKQIKGNKAVVSGLEKMLASPETCPHSFLLTGDTGCGKTTIGRIIAGSLGSNGLDFKEVNSSDFRGIDTVRDIISKSQFKPIESDCIVWLIDECHKMTNDAQNALLKILEDTPNHVYFILCTTEPQKLLSTIKGRCLNYQVTPISNDELSSLLKSIIKKEGEELDDNILDFIITNSGGKPRNALQILEKVLLAEPDERLEIAKAAEAEKLESIELCRALINGKSWREVSIILSSLKEQGQDAESVRRIMLVYCQSVLLKKDLAICGLILEEFLTPFYDSGFPQLVYACYSVTKNK